MSLFARKNDIPKDIASSEPTFVQLYESCKKFTMTSLERMYALYKSLEYLSQNHISGDIVECGVWKGGSAMLCALTLEHFGDTDRLIYLYDTYTGMTEPTQSDFRVSDPNTQASVKWMQTQKDSRNDWAYAPIEEVKNNMMSTGYPKECVQYVIGDVKETITTIVPERIALLRLDTDWYESTKQELTHLFPLLCSRGVLIIDDYGHWAGSKRATDEFLSTQCLFLSRIDYSGRLGIKT
jgi:hypothetical protein